MSKYTMFYNKAVSLYKAGNNFLTPEMVYGNECYSLHEGKILDKVVSEVTQKGHQLAIKYHPTWYSMVRNGASSSQCLSAWKNDDLEGKYLDELTYI